MPIVFTKLTPDLVDVMVKEYNRMQDAFAAKYNMICKPHRATWASGSLQGRYELVFPAHVEKQNKQSDVYRPIDCKFKVGYLVGVTVAKPRRGIFKHTVFEIVKFSNRGKVSIKRLGDKKVFTCAPSLLCEVDGGR